MFVEIKVHGRRFLVRKRNGGDCSILSAVVCMFVLEADKVPDETSFELTDRQKEEAKAFDLADQRSVWRRALEKERENQRPRDFKDGEDCEIHVNRKGDAKGSRRHGEDPRESDDNIKHDREIIQLFGGANVIEKKGDQIVGNSQRQKGTENERRERE